MPMGPIKVISQPVEPEMEEPEVHEGWVIYARYRGVEAKQYNHWFTPYTNNYTESLTLYRDERDADEKCQELMVEGDLGFDPDGQPHLYSAKDLKIKAVFQSGDAGDVMIPPCLLEGEDFRKC